MSLKNHSHDEIVETSMIELANLILIEEKKAVDFRVMFDRIVEMKGFSKKQKEEYIAQFYTDLNIDGRFMTAGSNFWGLKRWYPADQVEEDITTTPKKKKKKTVSKKKPVKTGFDEDPEENLDLDEEELDFDEEIEAVETGAPTGKIAEDDYGESGNLDDEEGEDVSFTDDDDEDDNQA